MIAWLSVGFYEGWRPKRAEVADLIAVELGALTVEEADERVRQRRRGAVVPDVSPDVFAYVVSRGSSIPGGSRYQRDPGNPSAMRDCAGRYTR
jgi:hypothetical protein